ncbi:MAG: alpha/beta hydrolase family protein [Syntrophothermus sp.]
MTKDFILYTISNEKLRITTYGYEQCNTAPCIIFVHGFKGFKDWGFGPYLAEFFADMGYFVITFNFSHNGVGDALTEFIEMDKFAENTYSLEVDELTELITAYQFGFFGNEVPNDVALLGHSRGGAISLLTAKNMSIVKAVAVWASVSKLDRYSERQKEKWKKDGVFEVQNSRTNQLMKMNYSFLEDLEENKDDILNVQKAVKELKKPLFIAHGEQDLSVPITEGEQLYKWSSKKLTEFYKIPTAGHTFGIAHPFTESNLMFEELLNKTEEFFRTNLF